MTGLVCVVAVTGSYVVADPAGEYREWNESGKGVGMDWGSDCGVKEGCW